MGIADLLTVRDTERVILTDTVIDTVTDTDRVGNIDPAMVVRGEGVLVTERDCVLDTVGLTDRVNGRVVGTGDLLLVILPDTLRVTVTETERVANIDPRSIWRGEGDTVIECVRVTDTVGVRDRGKRLCCSKWTLRPCSTPCYSEGNGWADRTSIWPTGSNRAGASCDTYTYRTA